MVDTIVVGKFLGVKALAGVGSTGSLSFLVLGFCIGVCNGFAIPVAQKFGERDYPGLKRFVVNAILLAVAFSLVMTAVVCSLCSPLLGWMNTPADIVDDAFAYIFVIFLGIPVVFIYNVLFSIIRSLGDSRTPVIYLVICSLLNVALDLLFILAFGMGVEGAAWATVISQAVSSLLCVKYIRHCDLLILTRRDWKLDKTCVKRLVGMGVPTGLQYSITAIGSIVLQASVNLLGSSYVASVAAGSKVSQLFCCPFDALGSTMATYGGQNVGAGKLERIGKGLKSCSAIGIVYSLAAFGSLSMYGGNLSQMFMDARETQVIANSALFLNRELGRLHPAGLCQHRALFDSGPGLYPSGRVCRRAGNGRPRDRGRGDGARVRLYRRVRGQPGRVGGGRPVPFPRLWLGHAPAGGCAGKKPKKSPGHAGGGVCGRRRAARTPETRSHRQTAFSDPSRRGCAWGRPE